MFASVATPDSEAELVAMVALLNAYDIPHFVHNRHQGGLYPGNPWPLLTIQRVIVFATHVSEAKELLAPFFGPPLEFESERRLALRDRVRGVVEFFLGGWVVAAKRWVPSNVYQDSKPRGGARDESATATSSSFAWRVEG